MKDTTQTTNIEKRIRETLESLAKGHFIEWGDKSYTRINVSTIVALQKLFFGEANAN